MEYDKIFVLMLYKFCDQCGDRIYKQNDKIDNKITSGIILLQICYCTKFRG